MAHGVPEKKERNKGIVALYLCGFNYHAISRLFNLDYRNTIMFIQRDTPKYKEEILNHLVRKVATEPVK